MPNPHRRTALLVFPLVILMTVVTFSFERVPAVQGAHPAVIGDTPTATVNGNTSTNPTSTMVVVTSAVLPSPTPCPTSSLATAGPTSAPATVVATTQATTTQPTTAPATTQPTTAVATNTPVAQITSTTPVATPTSGTPVAVAASGGTLTPTGTPTARFVAHVQLAAASPCLAASARLVDRFTVRRAGNKALLRWRMIVQDGIKGFNVYAGATRLNRQLIPTHTAASYRYGTAWRQQPFLLHIVPRYGKEIVVPSQ